LTIFICTGKQSPYESHSRWKGRKYPTNKHSIINV